MKSLILRIALLVFGSCLGHTAVAELPSAAMLANTCAGCHGTNGSSVGPASPTIAGISRDYFIESMKAYQSGDRLSTIMQRIAKGYSEAEIELMADYFSLQSFIRHKQEHDVKKADLGRRLHKKYCEKCHEDDGRTADDDSSILAGQWAAYLRFSMQDFINGDRPMEKKKQQRVKELQTDHGDKGVEALIQFYASQQ